MLGFSVVSQDAWHQGELVAGRYRLHSLLGRGGVGEVWRAEHVMLRTPVAIKLVSASRAQEGAADKLLREARAAMAIQSPHVVQIVEYGRHDADTPFIVMELLEGEDLAQRLARATGPLPHADVARIVTHVARAVDKAHEHGIVHRDLKPENIFLVGGETGFCCKVFDFGIAKLTPRLSHGVTANSRIGTLLGTPAYMSPEQIRGDRPIDHRADFWSLAVIAFECLTGRLPFEGPALGELMRAIVAGPIPLPSQHASVPETCDAWFLRAVSRDPDGRFSSAREMARELSRILVGRSLDDDPARAVSGELPVLRPSLSSEPSETYGRRRPRSGAWSSALLVAPPRDKKRAR